MLTYKTKRIVCICCIIMWGMISEFYLLRMCNPIEDLQHPFLGYIFVFFRWSTFLTDAIFSLIGVYSPYWLGVCILFFIQFIIYSIIGLVISNLLFKSRL